MVGVGWDGRRQACQAQAPCMQLGSGMARDVSPYIDVGRLRMQPTEMHCRQGHGTAPWLRVL